MNRIYVPKNTFDKVTYYWDRAPVIWTEGLEKLSFYPTYFGYYGNPLGTQVHRLSIKHRTEELNVPSVCSGNATCSLCEILASPSERLFILPIFTHDDPYVVTMLVGPKHWTIEFSVSIDKRTI